MRRRVALAGLLAWPAVARGAERTVTDMAGRTVGLPARVERVVTLGSLPVLNSFVFAMGRAATLRNGLADFARPQWRFQVVFAPHIATLPTMQQPSRAPNLEAILLAAPDVVLTMHRESVDMLAARGVPTVFLAWREAEDAKACMDVLGAVFDDRARADAYRRRFDDTVELVRARVAAIPAAARPRVLYLQPSTLSQPRLIAEWWIPSAGGISVTDDGRSAETRTFTLEQAMLWDPDMLIVGGRKEAAELRGHRVLSRLAAVRAGRVHVAPTGAHNWANRTAEQPLTVLWAAMLFHPDRFADIDLAAETTGFYREVFGHAPTPGEVAEILAGST